MYMKGYGTCMDLVNAGIWYITVTHGSKFLEPHSIRIRAISNGLRNQPEVPSR